MSSEVMRYRLEHNTPAREVQPGRDINILRGTVMVTEADHGRTIDALLAERDALAKALDRQVPLHDAIQRAAGELPNGWEIRLCVERDAGWVELYDPDGNDIEDFATDAERLDYTVNDALEHALQGAQP